MFVYEEAWDYDSYLESDLAEYKEKQEKIFERINLHEDTVKKLEEINSIVNIVVFAEIYCPDCRALIPYLEKFARKNEKININIFPRKGNEKYVERHSKESKIPLVLVEDFQKGEEEFETIFEEVLPSVKKELDENKDILEKERIVYEFRTGKRNEELEKYLMERIIQVIS